MKKLLRFLLLALAAVVVVLFVAMTVLMTVIDPNDFKEEIAKAVHQHTGRTFSIEGDIHWRFFPTFGLQAQNITLGNAPGFEATPFAQLAHATLELRLSRLLIGKVALGTLELKSGHITLERLSSGQVNWEGFGKSVPTTQAARAAAPFVMVVSATTPAKKSALALSISGLSVEDVTINYRDGMTNTAYSLGNLSLLGRDIQFDRPFSLQAKTEFSTPEISGTLELNGYTALYPSHQQYALSQFSINASTQFSQTPQITQRSSIVLDAEVDLATQQFEITNLDGTLFDNPITAQLAIHQNKTGYSAKGCFESPKLTWQKLSLESVNAKVSSHDGEIRILPITAKAYEGALDAQIVLSSEPAAPLGWHATGTLSNINTQALTEALLPTAILSGTASGELDISGKQLQTPTQSLNSLNGTLAFKAEKGSLVGFDLQKLFLALMNQRSEAQAGEETLFNELTGSIAIANGVVSNDDLLLRADEYTAEGHGTLRLKADNLMQSPFEYSFAANAPKVSKDIPLAIRAHGTLSGAKVEPDLKAYAKALLKKKLKKGFFEQLNKGDTLPTTDDTNANSDEPQDNNPFKEFETLFDRAGDIFR